jgi:hypothetical protein
MDDYWEQAIIDVAVGGDDMQRACLLTPTHPQLLPRLHPTWRYLAVSRSCALSGNGICLSPLASCCAQQAVSRRKRRGVFAVSGQSGMDRDSTVQDTEAPLLQLHAATGEGRSSYSGKFDEVVNT